MEEIYVVKVRTDPDPARLYPSERRYSALTVGGLGAVHLLLAATSLLLGCLGLALQSDSCWTGRYGGGLWLGVAAALAGVAGILAWRRWYIDNNIRWFFISSAVAATTSLLCLIITAAALAAILEQKSSQEVYKSIYYDQGIIYEEPAVNDFQDIPSLNLQKSDENFSTTQTTTVISETKTSSQIISPEIKSQVISSNANVSVIKNKDLDNVSIDDTDETWLEEHLVQLNDSWETDIKAGDDNVKENTNKSTHIMRISKTNKPTEKIDESLLFALKTIRDSTNSSSREHYSRLRKSTENNQSKEDNNNTQDTFVSSVNDESQDVQNVPQNTENNIYIYNHTISDLPTPKRRLKHEQPKYEKVPRGGREVRTVVAINILVASALELAWSLLSVSIAWKGMKNCYTHENTTSTCERTVEGLERSAPTPPPPSNTTFTSNKSHHKMDNIFRKPDIISNHRQCKVGEVEDKNRINKLMINTVSERISNDPYLPMEENTMGYQERVHRFLASNNANVIDNVNNIES